MNPILARRGTLVTITRPGKGKWISGKWVVNGSTADSTFTALCVIQPYNPQEMMALPEGERTQHRLKIYSDILLQPVVDDPTSKEGQKGDRLTYGTRTYEIKSTQTWDIPKPTRLQHFKSEAVMIEYDTKP